MKKEIKKEQLAVMIDTFVLKRMFEGKNEGKVGELLKKMKQMKDEGIKMKVLSTQASFARAIYLADPKTSINNIQKV